MFSRTPQTLWGGKDVIARTAIGDLAIRLRDPGAQYLLTFGTLADERGETAFMRHLLPRLGVVFDLGANYGWYARMARDLGSDPMVVAVEANPSLMPYLRHNVGPAVHLIHAAVLDRGGEVTFYLSENSTLSSWNRDVGEPVTVQALTVDEICAQVGRSPDLIKCDVEGGELAVLRGATMTRAGACPPIWLIEAYERYLVDTGSSYADLHDELSRFGPVDYYRADLAGQLVALENLEALRGTSYFNVIVVPAARASLIHSLGTTAP